MEDEMHGDFSYVTQQNTQNASGRDRSNRPKEMYAEETTVVLLASDGEGRTHVICKAMSTRHYSFRLRLVIGR